MKFTVRSTLFLFSVVGTLSVSNAYSNGRKPPQSRDVSVVNATCAARSGDPILEILRVRVTDGHGSRKTVSVLEGNVTEQLAMADIDTLVLPSAAVDSRGFVNAKLRRNDDDAESRVRLQVRSGKAELRLAGFKSNGAAVRIPLSKCKKIEFSTSAGGADDLDEKPEAKK